jgi:hypothetical protein
MVRKGEIELKFNGVLSKTPQELLGGLIVRTIEWAEQATMEGNEKLERRTFYIAPSQEQALLAVAYKYRHGKSWRAVQDYLRKSGIPKLLEIEKAEAEKDDTNNKRENIGAIKDSEKAGDAEPD